jgi:hypothetical protein
MNSKKLVNFVEIIRVCSLFELHACVISMELSNPGHYGWGNVPGELIRVSHVTHPT